VAGGAAVLTVPVPRPTVRPLVDRAAPV